MRSFRDLPIKNKLTLVIMLTSCSILLLAATATLVNEFLTHRNAMVKSLAITARIIGLNSGAALTFNDPVAATETLNSLNVEPHIIAAFLYKEDNSIFAQYYSPSHPQPKEVNIRLLPPGEKSFFFEDGSLTLYQPIILNNTSIGTVCLRSDLLAMYSTMKRIGTVAALIVVISFGLAFFLSSRLQRLISTPLLDLSRTVSKISREKNYTVRAKKASNDEIGLLIDGLNDMLDQIQRHDRQLTQHREQLEAEVINRTEELSESEEKFRQLSQATFEAIVIHTSHSIVEVNQAFSEMFGYSRDEGCGFNFAELVIRKERGRIRQFFKDDQAKIFETTGLRKDGSSFKAEVCSKFSHFKGQTVSVKAVRDITNRKQMEEELLQARKLESIGILAGGIAHDFNNLLTAILGNISLVKLTLASDSTHIPRLNDAENACMRAKDLSQQLLTFSRGGAPVKKRTSLNAIIKEAVDFSLRGSNVKCCLELKPDLWLVDVDPGQITQVINNLMINADQAMPDGGQIFVRADNVHIKQDDSLSLNSGNYVLLSIEDQGTGIIQEHLNKIFDPYFTTKQAGSGLGLASCYSIIKHHGGSITVTSEENQGTTFIIYLPVAPLQGYAERPKPIAPVPIASGKILIMDDEEMIRNVAGALLKTIGYQVDFAADGRETIRKYQEARTNHSPFDAVIMDLTIPGGMGGKETIGKLLEIDPQVKAIVSSGYANDRIMANYGDYGFSDVVAKPYRLDELGRAVERIICGLRT